MRISTVAPLLALILVEAVTCVTPLMAQVSLRILPYSVQVNVEDALATFTVPPARLPAPKSKVLDDETEMPLVRPYQHGVETPVDLGFENAGQWRLLPDGGRLWRLRIVSEGARSLNLVYDDFWMPEGTRLFLYNDDRSVVLGAFTHQNNKPHGGFATDLVPGDVTILEYYEPAGVAARARLHISTVVQGRPVVEAPRKGALMGSDEPYVPIALPCSINAQCSEGWTDEAQAVVRIVRGGNSCTGVLLNNTQQDRTPYVLSVNHCGAPAVGDTLNWVFQFNYRSAGCADPSQTPTPQSVSGAVVRAAQGGAADFALLELLEPIPTSYQVEYAGWSIEDNVSQSDQVSSYGVVIGHPRGDIMKITFEDDPILDILSTYWIATFDRGTIESGSSGSPLFNDQRQVIGLVRAAYQIDYDACSGPGGDDNGARIAFPRLSYIWDLGVGAFLDPDNQGATSISSLAGKASIWINEVNADAQPSGLQNDEFVELVGLPGTVLDGFTLDVYSCTGGATTLESSHAINSFTLQNDYVNFGIFVFGGSGLDAALRDQIFSGGGTDVLPDGSGLLALKDDTGSEVFDYQYDSAADCPATYTTRSQGDPSGSSTMGFITSAIPTASSTASNSLTASPGAENFDGGQVLPVELVSFDALLDGQAVELRWQTASETNNAGFEIQHSPFAPTNREKVGATTHWQVLAFIDGHGTTLQPQTYRYRAENLLPGRYRFRLKQIDFDGTFDYSPELEVSVGVSEAYHLTASYPNPFNPLTHFSLSVARTQRVEVSVYNLLGQRVALLYEGLLEGGITTSFQFNGDLLPSGLYVIRVQGEHFLTSQTVTLLK